jgi:hypothetical protein
MHRILEWFKEEIREFLGAALFFALAACLIVLANKLKFGGSDIEVVSLARAIVIGMIVAKVLITVDLLPFVDAFPGKPLVYNIIWKTLIYIAASLLFRYIEPTITSLFAGAKWSVASHHAVQGFTQPAFWSTEIWIALFLLIFVTGRELTRFLGNDKVRLIFIGR